jgi:hypothetical protein
VSGGELSREAHGRVAAWSSSRTGAARFAIPLIRSAAFSPIISVGALVLLLTRRGMIEESHTRRRSRPRSFSSGSTTAIASAPILQVPTGW